MENYVKGMYVRHVEHMEPECAYKRKTCSLKLLSTYDPHSHSLSMPTYHDLDMKLADGKGRKFLALSVSRFNYRKKAAYRQIFKCNLFVPSSPRVFNRHMFISRTRLCMLLLDVSQTYAHKWHNRYNEQCAIDGDPPLTPPHHAQACRYLILDPSPPLEPLLLRSAPKVVERCLGNEPSLSLSLEPRSRFSQYRHNNANPHTDRKNDQNLVTRK